MSDVLAVVLLAPEDATDPPGRMLRRRLGGVTLADRAVHLLSEALPGSQVITSALERDLAALIDPAEIQVVLFYDPSYPFIPVEWFPAVCRAVDPVAGTEVAAVAVTEVTDTLKRVDDADRVEATVDRQAHRALIGLLAVTPAVLGAVLASSWRKGGQLADLVAALDRVVGVGQVLLAGRGSVSCRVTDDDALRYAEAVLAASNRSATTTSSG